MGYVSVSACGGGTIKDVEILYEGKEDPVRLYCVLIIRCCFKLLGLFELADGEGEEEPRVDGLDGRGARRCEEYERDMEEDDMRAHG